MSDAQQTQTGKGRCLCGAIEIVAQGIHTNAGACHCSTCRTWSGGPNLTLECQGQVELSGADPVVYSSSEWAERAFCGQCGTHLYYRLKGQAHYFLPAGLFNLDDELVFDHQVFIDEKPAYYCFANETRDMTGAEVFAQFSEGEA